MTKGDLMISKLQDEGWLFDHYATYHGYMPAGYISLMNRKKGILIAGPSWKICWWKAQISTYYSFEEGGVNHGTYQLL